MINFWLMKVLKAASEFGSVKEVLHGFISLSINLKYYLLLINEYY